MKYICETMAKILQLDFLKNYLQTKNIGFVYYF